MSTAWKVMAKVTQYFTKFRNLFCLCVVLRTSHSRFYHSERRQQLLHEVPKTSTKTVRILYRASAYRDLGPPISRSCPEDQWLLFLMPGIWQRSNHHVILDLTRYWNRESKPGPHCFETIALTTWCFIYAMYTSNFWMIS